MKPARVLTASERSELEAFENRALSPEEFEARVNAPWTPHEVDDFEALVGWFRRRYPSPGDRLRAMRRRMDVLRRANR